MLLIFFDVLRYGRAECPPADIAGGIVRLLKQVAADPTAVDCRYNEHLTPSLRAIRGCAVRILASPSDAIAPTLRLVVDTLLDVPDPATMSLFAAVLQVHRADLLFH